MALVIAADHMAGGHIQSGKQRGRAVTCIVMRVDVPDAPAPEAAVVECGPEPAPDFSRQRTVRFGDEPQKGGQRERVKGGHLGA